MIFVPNYFSEGRKIMLKKWIVIATLLCASLPMVANAASWTLNTWVRTSGGNIVSRNWPTPQTNVNGSVFKVYTTSKSIPVSVNAAAGYTISNVTKNGSTVATSGTTYSTTVSGPTAQTVWANFAVMRVSVTTSAGTGGSVTPSGTTNYNYGTQSPPIVIVFTPLPGNNVIDITGLPSSGYTLTNNGNGQTVTLPAPTNVAVRVTITSLTSSLTLGGVFINYVPVVANAGLPQTILMGSTNLVVLDGSQSTGPILTYSWVQTAGPVTVSLSGANNVTATFPLTSSLLGTYKFNLTVTGIGNSSTATAIVSITNSAAEAAWNQCASCHQQNGIGQNPNVFLLWSTSKHERHNPPVMCYNCHVGANTGAHPGPVPVFVVWNACSTCHIPGNTWGLPWPPPGLSFHNNYTGTNLCYQCHNAHNPSIVTGGAPYPHFANSTTAAQFVNPNIGCDNCHVSAVDNSFNIYPANYQWADTGKANPKSPAYMVYQFKSMGTPAPATPAISTANDCVRCHTTTGYINYVSSNFTNIAPFGQPLGSREMVACPACHNPTPFSATFSRRSVGVETNPTDYPGILNVKTWYGYSSAVTKKIILDKTFDNADGNAYNDSNICIACHTGRAVGALIKSIGTKVGNTGPFWQNVNFIDPHNMGAANIMFDVRRSAYEYRSIFTAPAHVGIRVNNSTQGPCVGCHMSAPKKHLFSAISTASNGVITAITSPVCAECHPSSGPPMDATILESKKTGFEATMAVIVDQLVTKGIYFNSSKYPYFFTTQNYDIPTVNWNYDNTWQGADLMGAAFNLRLLQSDQGAYVHHSVYIKKILHDTIEYLNYGNVTGRDLRLIDPPVLTPAAQAYLYP